MEISDGEPRKDDDRQRSTQRERDGGRTAGEHDRDRARTDLHEARARPARGRRAHQRHGRPRQAELVTFKGESLVDATNWHVSTNWRNQNGCHVVPASADDAVVPWEAATLGTGHGAAQSVVVDTNAHLDVDGQTLSVGTNAPGVLGLRRVWRRAARGAQSDRPPATVYATFIAPDAEPGVFRIEDPLINCP